MDVNFLRSGLMMKQKDSCGYNKVVSCCTRGEEFVSQMQKFDDPQNYNTFKWHKTVTTGKNCIKSVVFTIITMVKLQRF